ncbi:thioredoxin family protein [Brachyspira pilosicoli]|uniref:thioredoxin family protein n=1 Tax=Brachyspira pilosicoli TaxID=52584 RepID=UPI001CA4A25E|nr:thioredoxin family protein [Brachyspira pilosicoli]MBW5398306.1 DUF255 domain-containing protein [Brachyspira pilosicoli]
MKNIFTIAFSILLLSCNNNQNTQLINWETNYNTALEKAIKENKTIMIDFYTDWCTICKIMETNVYLDKDIVSNINYNFVPLKINAEYNDKNIKLLTNQYNISAFPTTVFINTNNFIIKKILGYIDTNDLLEEIKNIEEKKENINKEFSNDNPTVEKLKIYIDSEYYKEAMEMYDILLKENKIEKEDIPTYLVDIGTLLFYNEQFDEGIKYFNEVLNNHSNSQKLYEAIYFNGIYKIIMGNKEEGINYLKNFTNSITNDELRNQYIEAIEYYK